jgi:hypothetical protein
MGHHGTAAITFTRSSGTATPIGTRPAAGTPSVGTVTSGSVMSIKRRFVSDVQLSGDIGTAIATLRKTTLRAWGFDTDRAIVTWRDEVRAGVWIEGTALKTEEAP